MLHPSPQFVVEHMRVFRGGFDAGVVEGVLDQLQVPGGAEQPGCEAVAIVMPAVVRDTRLLPAAAPMGLEALDGDRPALATATAIAGALGAIGKYEFGVVPLAGAEQPPHRRRHRHADRLAPLPYRDHHAGGEVDL